MNQENQKIKQDVKNAFDSVAVHYDGNRHFVMSANKLVDLIDMTKPRNILDLSTGTGHIAIELAKRFPQAEIHAVDISNEMLNIARTKTREQGVTNIQYHQQDVEELVFEDIAFDLITCGYGLFFYPDMDRVFECFKFMYQKCKVAHGYPRSPVK